ncbi:glycosyltransferase family 2 protein [Goodfellowiella coeruleoviolacea]|uniref:Glycosyltransferase involved in cell wall bisynthesis n=1 Tax=Goodfellowiella coeruleoviolacea TaxID=334858 RepID=A0AAE3GL58_9PSEU|nr:glycosyltransferase family 2 protein [Goodfellowiella coeruleoviolacea]MCP2169512.1 Glycosyltransferase involved in cell wall bisynthesis [Goodfellowiella coeruleoviolacea]
MSDTAAAPARAGLTVVIPCFNEADNIIPSYQEITAELGDHDLELLYVDDGSTDETLARVRALAGTDSRVQFISFTRNFGFEAAFSAGYRYARQPWVLHVDADQQFPAAEARKLIAAADQGYDAVFGVRTNRKDPLPRRWGTTAFHVLARWLRVELPRGATAFRLVRAPLARAVVDLRLGTPYFLATVPRLTSRYTTVAVGHRARQRGRSKVGYAFLARHAIELFVGYTRRLTTAASVGALLAAGCAALAGLGAAVGLLTGRAAAAAVFGLLAVVLVALSMTVRYLVAVGAGQPRPRLYYIREASLPVDPAELLFGDPRPAEPGPGGSGPGGSGSEGAGADESGPGGARAGASWAGDARIAQPRGPGQHGPAGALVEERAR